MDYIINYYILYPPSPTPLPHPFNNEGEEYYGSAEDAAAAGYLESGGHGEPLLASATSPVAAEDPTLAECANEDGKR